MSYIHRTLHFIYQHHHASNLEQIVPQYLCLLLYQGSPEGRSSDQPPYWHSNIPSDHLHVHRDTQEPPRSWWPTWPAKLDPIHIHEMAFWSERSAEGNQDVGDEWSSPRVCTRASALESPAHRERSQCEEERSLE